MKNARFVRRPQDKWRSQWANASREKVVFEAECEHCGKITTHMFSYFERLREMVLLLWKVDPNFTTWTSGLRRLLNRAVKEKYGLE